MNPPFSRLFQDARPLGPRDQGVGSGPINIEAIDAAQRYAMVALLGCALWNSLEMVPVILLTFKRYSGLYFWSMVASTVGVVLGAIGFIFVIFNIGSTSAFPPGFMAAFGWVPMVSGQSLVLFSRLHLLSLSRRLRKCILAEIIFTIIFLQIPTVTLTVGSQTSHPDQHAWIRPYEVFERIQVTVFFVQEVSLSSLYLWKCFEFLMARGGTGSSFSTNTMRDDGRKMFIHLFIANIIVIALDVTILCLQYSGLFLFQISYKPFAYSVKLKIEASILGQLVEFVEARHKHGTFTLTAEAQQEWGDTLQRIFGTTGGTNSQDDKCHAGNRDQSAMRHSDSDPGAGAGTGSGPASVTAHASATSKKSSREACIYPASRDMEWNAEGPFVRWWHPEEVKEVYIRRQSQGPSEALQGN